ncbi:MAG: hypothetical protein KGJ23_08165 [Euryarchaeota archaeon]|nr:hypothetical protein [Euryarchaeota archaeon]MDE1836576.1 hypothetical protein [Euryarchaeota archaeon]MDE1879229.1 hypothetical protein [Euryarchaeota archaeon]MDE2044546.1 hypothetical protein [Thermoplasmata archaeon]
MPGIPAGRTADDHRCPWCVGLGLINDGGSSPSIVDPKVWIRCPARCPNCGGKGTVKF